MASNDNQQATDEATYERLRDASSLGTPAARKLRGRTDFNTMIRTWIAAQTSEPAELVALHPHTYNDARAIGEHFRRGLAVVVDLTEIDDADGKRLIDFMAGLTFAVGGQIERMGRDLDSQHRSGRIFLLTPGVGTSRASQSLAGLAESPHVAHPETGSVASDPASAQQNTSV